MILSTVRFTADIVWYPGIARALSSHILADLLFDCLSDGRVISGKSDHASSIGMALTTVLSVHLNMRPEDESLKELCNCIDSDIKLGPSSQQLFAFVMTVLKFLAGALSGLRRGTAIDWGLTHRIPDLSTTHKLWLGRVILETIWRCRRIQDPTTVLTFYSINTVCKRLMIDGDETPIILRTNCFLIMAIALGLRIDIHDLYAPNNTCVVPSFFPSNSLIE